MNVDSAGQGVTVTDKLTESARRVAFIVAVPGELIAFSPVLANIHLPVNADEMKFSSLAVDADITGLDRVDEEDKGTPIRI
jgi:hypothetical protein